MFWANPLAPQHATVRENGIRTRLPASVRVATVQFQMRRISQISEFEEQVEYFVDVASDYHADFVVFPELFTLELLSIEREKRSEEHKSELQSLMRISYAVFCLKKTTKIKTKDIYMTRHLITNKN